MKCDTIANGIVQAAKNIGLKKPVIIRLEGTNVEIAKKVIDDAGISDVLINAADLDDAAIKACEVAYGK
jgi:succinyl-CoA synthetase beta subunit